MASFKGDIKSKALSMDIALNVILPYDHPHDYSQDPCNTARAVPLPPGCGGPPSNGMPWSMALL